MTGICFLRVASVAISRVSFGWLNGAGHCGVIQPEASHRGSASSALTSSFRFRAGDGAVAGGSILVGVFGGPLEEPGFIFGVSGGTKSSNRS